MVDWSGGNDRGPTPKSDAIWACIARGGVADAPVYLRHRGVAETWLADMFAAECTAGRRVCAGFDFPFGYPAGFARALTGGADPLQLWDWFAERVKDAPKTNNRFDLAGEINLRFGGNGPFWGNGLRRNIDGLPRTKVRYDNPFSDRRAAEIRAKGAFTCWQLSGAGAVGSQVIMGLPVLARLRRRFAGQVSVWPFEALTSPIAFVEIWPSLFAGPAPEGTIKDAHQVRCVAERLSALPPVVLTKMLRVDAPEEGWILGLGHEDVLRPALTVPPMRNDCFALPQDVEWTPVDQALALLQKRMTCVTDIETIATKGAAGRVLGRAATALRSHPPAANSAVDGYGFAHAAIGDGPQTLSLTQGRAAAGAPYQGIVQAGSAIRILTGANLPQGVDTVVLQEDTRTDGHAIAFHGPLKRGANTRKAGEDMAAGDDVLPQGRVLTPADLATLSAVGIGKVRVRRPLRVAILSTGDELREAGTSADIGQIYDANRPMLRAVAERWGYGVIDLGRAADSRAALRGKLTQGAADADVIVTSGGASAGDEDHVSALLGETGSLAVWRIAMKPGRPLALGVWDGTPVFGLPGNPVAAMVCTLIFARPALALLAGSDWTAPQGFLVPAAFAKTKKAGRREYLRARIRDGQAEVFAFEGSGRVSGLSWAEGLVELGDGAADIAPGDSVTFIPWGSFGL
jgi:molybdopterin molybdotransferase